MGIIVTVNISRPNYHIKFAWHPFQPCQSYPCNNRILENDNNSEDGFTIVALNNSHSYKLDNNWNWWNTAFIVRRRERTQAAGLSIEMMRNRGTEEQDDWFISKKDWRIL